MMEKKVNTWKEFVLKIIYLDAKCVSNAYRDGIDIEEMCTPEFRKKLFKALFRECKKTHNRWITENGFIHCPYCGVKL